MEELLRQRAVPSLTLQCFRCGLTKEMEDDGRRVHQAQVHTANCPDRPETEAHMALTSPDRLEMRLEDGGVWFQIERSGKGRRGRSQ